MRGYCLFGEIDIHHEIDIIGVKNMRVSKWGNSLAIRLPASLVKELGLSDGDEIEIEAARKKYLLLSREQRREEALKRIEASNWKLPEGWKFDREEANAR
jgi:antitoxin MazE